MLLLCRSRHAPIRPTCLKRCEPCRSAHVPQVLTGKGSSSGVVSYQEARKLATAPKVAEQKKKAAPAEKKQAAAKKASPAKAAASSSSTFKLGKVGTGSQVRFFCRGWLVVFASLLVAWWERAGRMPDAGRTRWLAKG